MKSYIQLPVDNLQPGMIVRSTEKSYNVQNVEFKNGSVTIHFAEVNKGQTEAHGTLTWIEIDPGVDPGLPPSEMARSSDTMLYDSDGNPNPGGLW